MPRGKIKQSPGNGKLLCKFPFDVAQEADGRIINKKIEILAYIQNKYSENSEPPKEVIATQFFLKCEDEREYGTDLNACLKAMRSKLDIKYRIDWKPWLRVHVNPRRPVRGTGYGLELSWEEIEQGITLDGDILMRIYNTYADFNNRWEVSPWPKQHRDKTGKVVACVPKTDDNLKALEEFARKLKDLTNTLADFVAPENIEQTLAAIASGGIHLIENRKAKDKDQD